LSEQWFLKYPGVEASKSCVAHEGYKSAVKSVAKNRANCQRHRQGISGKSITIYEKQLWHTLANTESLACRSRMKIGN